MENQDQKIMVMIAVILIVLCCCYVGLALTWYEGDPIPTPTITSPTDEATVTPEQEVGCTATSANSEQDEWCDEGGTGYCSDTKIGDQSNQKWTKGAGSWKNGVSTGKSVTWVAPLTVDGQATLTYTIDDTGTTYYNDTSKSANVTVNYCKTVDNWNQLEACENKEQHPTKNKQQDGCSYSPEDPTQTISLCFPGDTSFHSCCWDHDTHYQTCNYNKGVADLAFLCCMEGVCEALPGGEEHECYEWCMTWSAVYSAMVCLVGDDAYQGDQVQYCVCCD